jgi:hypothetical protein
MNPMPAPAATKQFILPFAAQSESRKEHLAAEAEAAAIYALSELERKSGGIITKQTEEKISYITKIGYPLWLIPRGETTYVLDGLNKSTYTWQYFEASQTKFLIDDFEASFKIRESYMAFLSDYQNRFQQALIKKELTCNGLLANVDFLGEIESYRREAAEVGSQQSNVALLAPMIEETKVNSVIIQIEALKASFKTETEKLQQLIQLINKTTSQYTTRLQFEAEAVKEEAEAKIKAQEELINPKIVSLNKEYNNHLANLEKSIEKEQLPLEKQKNKLEKTIEAIKQKIAQIKKQAKIQANKRNTYSKENLKKKLKKAKKELSELEKQHKSTGKKLKQLSELKSNKIVRLKVELEAKVKEERQPVVDLEVSRNAKMLIFRQEIEKLEKQTKPVLDELDKSVKQREYIMSRVEPLGVKSDPKMKTAALLYVPFYVACYQGVFSKRYLIVSPSVAGSMGFSAKLKGALGRSKIKDLLTPRFKTVSGLADKIRLNANGDSEFEAEIEKLAQKTNVLNRNPAHLDIKRGLAYLKDEGWLSEAEYQGFVEKI